MSLKIGRKGRLYLVEEAGSAGGNGAGYGQVQDGSSGSNILSAGARAMRHIDFKFTYDPFGRVNSTEKKTSPGQVVQFDRRSAANLDTLAALLRPSGVLNTLPECSPVLKAAFGSVRNTTLSTTVNDAAATTTGATLTSVVGLEVGDPLLFIVGGKKYVRFVTAIAGSDVTWAPALPAAPADTSAVKAGIVYRLTTDLALSLAMLHCLDSFRRECRGIGIDKLSLTFDANSEMQFSASGPAQKQLTDGDAVADPATFTQVGGNPPSGIVGNTYIGDTVCLMKKAQFDLTNSLAVRNEELGSNGDSGVASDIYRAGRRSVSLSLDTFAEDVAVLHDFAMDGTHKSFFTQVGRTEGNIVALYLPIVDWKVPDTDSPEGPTNWSFKGTALESADEANDEVMLALL